MVTPMILNTELKPHQKRLVERLQSPDTKGLVAYWGLGSGKTLGSIAAAEALGLPTDVVVPAALQANFEKEVAKHTDIPFAHTTQSLEKATRAPGSLKSPFMIVDEAHRSRNPGKTQQALKLSPAQKKLLLTGSLMYNHPFDMAAPINIAAGSKVLPTSQAEFEGSYLRDRKISPGFFNSLIGAPPDTVTELNPKHKKKLQEILKKYVDYYPGSSENFPTRSDETIKVPMGPQQRKIYDTLIEKAPPWVQYKVKHNLPPSKAEATQLNSFLTGIRQVANTTSAFDERNAPEQPKITRAVEELKKQLDANPAAKAVVYSNFLSSGIAPYKKELERLKIPYGEFTGEVPRKTRDQLVKDYNENKIRALLLSGAGGEGLDLKGTRLMQLMEPHWNEEKLKQVIGRGIRFKSHEGLPPEQQNVLIQRFLSTRPRTGLLERSHVADPGSSVDEYLQNMSQRKENLKNQFLALLQEKNNARS